MSETHFDEVANSKTRLKTQNWIVLFPATGHIIQVFKLIFTQALITRARKFYSAPFPEIIHV